MVEARHSPCHQGSNHKEILFPFPILKARKCKAVERKLRTFLQIPEQSVGYSTVQKWCLLRTVEFIHLGQRDEDLEMILQRWAISHIYPHTFQNTVPPRIYVPCQNSLFFAQKASKILVVYTITTIINNRDQKIAKIHKR